VIVVHNNIGLLVVAATVVLVVVVVVVVLFAIAVLVDNPLDPVGVVEREHGLFGRATAKKNTSKKLYTAERHTRRRQRLGSWPGRIRLRQDAWEQTKVAVVVAAAVCVVVAAVAVAVAVAVVEAVREAGLGSFLYRCK